MNYYGRLIKTIKRTVDTVARKLFQEQGVVCGYSWGKQSKPIVQDDVIAKKGAAEYVLMMKDPDVKAAMATKAYGVLAKGYQITPAVGDGEPEYEAAKQQAEFVEMVFDKMPGALKDRLQEILKDCIGLGGCIAEKLWQWDTDLNFIMLSDIKVKDPNLYENEQDDYGNITKLILTAKGAKTEVDQSKFIRVAYNACHGDSWGESDLRSAYLYWAIKVKLVRWWACYLEKYAMPPVKGKYPIGMNQAEQEKLLASLTSIQQETSLIYPENVEVELMETTGKTSSEFNQALDYYGKQITKAILGQTLATEQNSKTGSLAQAKVHQDTLISYITNLKSMLESVIDEQVIRDIIDYNFADRYYPNFILPLDEKDIQQLAGIIYQLITCGQVDPRESWIREYLGLPEREELPEEPQPTPINQLDTKPPKRTIEQQQQQ